MSKHKQRKARAPVCVQCLARIKGQEIILFSEALPNRCAVCKAAPSHEMLPFEEIRPWL